MVLPDVNQELDVLAKDREVLDFSLVSTMKVCKGGTATRALAFVRDGFESDNDFSIAINYFCDLEVLFRIIFTQK